ncbi:MAG: hydrogenase, partial [Candidatus Neomarinimicrobiota bacterium]|nr:hydrogenase [Candidatus Neomarinimicrobiota bacterium]
MSEATIKSRAQTNSEELLLGDQTFTTITNDISEVPEQKKAPIQWKLALALALSLLAVFVGSLGYLIWEGTGIWGVNMPIGWGWAIINFVWWVGIGHAGT